MEKRGENEVEARAVNEQLRELQKYKLGFANVFTRFQKERNNKVKGHCVTTLTTHSYINYKKRKS